MSRHLTSAVMGLLALLNSEMILGVEQNKALSSTQGMQPQAEPQPQMEKCYGIVRAGMNDCQTSNQSCAGSAVKDKQPDAFILLPKGICDKIVGGKKSPH